MNRYVFRFTKTGSMRFISHLDLQRLFRRMFKRLEVELIYSKGYNPHPKMNIAQPLSLGFESNSEYLEIETEKSYDIIDMIKRGNEALTEGIVLTAGIEAVPSPKNLSSIVEYAEYAVCLPTGGLLISNEALDYFNSQKSIIVNKRDKKTKKKVEKDVKHLIYRLTWTQTDENELRIHTILRAASNEVLNPMLLMEVLCESVGISFEQETCRIVRTDLYCLEDGILIPLLDFCGSGKEGLYEKRKEK